MKLILISFLFLSTASAVAEDTKTWTCFGQDNYYNQGVEFNVVYSDWVQGVGYGYKAVEFATPPNDIVDLLKPANCSTTDMKEYQPEFQIKFVEQDPAFEANGIFKLEFFGSCEAEVYADITAYCKLN